MEIRTDLKILSAEESAALVATWKAEIDMLDAHAAAECAALDAGRPFMGTLHRPPLAG